MITVKFFGLISINHEIKQLILNEGTIINIFKEIHEQNPNISLEELMQAIVIINKRIILGKKRLQITLKDGDELSLLNPSSGG